MKSFFRHFKSKGEESGEKNQNGHPAKVTNPSPPWSSHPNVSARAPVAGEVNLDQQPTLVWMLEVGKVVALLIKNGVEGSKPEDMEKDHLMTKLKDLETRLNNAIYEKREKMGQSDTVGAVPVFKAESGGKGEEVATLATEIMQVLGGLQTKFLEHVGIIPVTAPVARKPATAAKSLQDYRDLFRAIPLPEVADTFQTEESFAKYRIAGPNPMTIHGVSRSHLLAMIGHRITDEQFNAVMGTSGDSLEQAGDDGRLCVANYRQLSGMDPIVIVGKSFVTDPIAVFAEPISGSDYIKPVAIQLGQDPKNTELLLANTSDTWRWQMAKTTVQVADFVVHELVSHLAQTHLIMEAFSVATQRNLSNEHPLHKLLMPHVEGTNFINHAAATSLISPNGPIDGIFANDRESRLLSLQSLAVRARFNYDFQNRAPDRDFKIRKVDKLKNFPYRDDSVLLWDAIFRWATNYVDLYYANDEAVAEDEALSHWSVDLAMNADLSNFDPPQSKAVLIRTLAMVIYVGSAQHAAVNYPQQSDATFPPAMPGAIWDEIPPLEDGPSSEQQWLNLLPSMGVAEEQVNILYLLGGVFYRRLGQYHSNVFPYLGTLDAKAEPALTNFREELEGIESIINSRNQARGFFSYTFLLPSRIPPSINI